MECVERGLTWWVHVRSVSKGMLKDINSCRSKQVDGWL